MNTNSLTAEREHLANLLEAVQRCAHFQHVSSSKVGWPLGGSGLKQWLVGAASRLLALCAQSLGVAPTTADFEAEFQRACAGNRSNLP